MACRICLEDSESGALLSVCNCDGTCKHVHRDCLQKWIETSQSTRCELCLAEYTHDYVQPTPTVPHTQHRERDCLILFVSCIWCGMFHGCLLAMDVWRGYQFRDNLVFGCLIFNVYHACIWIAISKMNRHTELVSCLWILSVTVGGWVTCLLLNSYNDQMTLSIYFNIAGSLIGLVLSVSSVQQCYRKCYRRCGGQGQVDETQYDATPSTLE
jgi:hypothetical protein